MANVYVRSAAAGAGTGADWANAYTTLGAALAAKAAGDTFWVAADHAESQAGAIVLTSPGTLASPCRVLCVDHTGSVPPVAADLRTSATITSTAGYVLINGSSYGEGITFSAATDLFCSQAFGYRQTWRNCDFVLSSGTAYKMIYVGGYTSSAYGRFAVDWINCRVKFGASSQRMATLDCAFAWRGGGVVGGGTTPAALFGDDDNVVRTARITVSGVDFSAFGSFALVEGTQNSSLYVFRNCKMPATWTLTTGTLSPGLRVEAYNCGSGDPSTVDHLLWIEDCFGSCKIDTGIYKDGGSSNIIAFSLKIATTADAEYPNNVFRVPLLARWNAAVSGTKTLTVDIVHDGAAAANNDEVWLETEIEGTTGNPLATFASDAPATVLTAAAAQAASAAAWTGDSGTGPNGSATWNQRKLEVAVDPKEQGYFLGTICAAWPSKTFYADGELQVA